MAFETIKIPSASVGNQAHIHLHRFGPKGVKGVKKVYIQAGLHADEHPGLLVAQHLLRHLEQLDQQNALKAEIVLVPFANPVGLRQKTFGHFWWAALIGTQGKILTATWPSILSK